jgi:hypothetical protein|tara:strand:+ start:1943 stop:2197 length:255 start_codon:yes stop_codon:yes gene_type:complete
VVKENNKNIYSRQEIKELISELVDQELIREVVFSRSKTIKRIIEIQNEMWIPIHRDKEKYFTDMDDAGLKRQLAMHEYALANPV